MKKDETVKTIKTTLWATDFSKESRFCLPYLKLFSNTLKTKNYALYVLPEFSDWVYEAVYLSDDALKRAVESTRKKTVTKILTISRKSGVDFEARVVEGIASEEIINYAKANHVDLIFAGRRGISKIEQMLIGSTTSRLARNSDIPVFVIPKGRRKVKIEKILCPIDLHEFSILELEYAISLSRQFNAALYVVHISEFYNYRVPMFSWDKLTNKVSKKITGLAKQYNYEIDRANIIYDIGEPAHKIIEIASKREIDVITMATHHRKGIEKFFLGSVAEKVLMGSDIPVIILPPPPAD
jgi:nucleotide-binding universal stress UspA family protein